MTLQRLSAAFLTLLLAACAAYDGYGLKPGIATGSDVRQAMGPPVLEFSDPDGSRHLVYPRGPLGVQTFIAHVAPDGKLQAIEQVLDDDHFRRIAPGMNREQVLRLIGPPGDSMQFRERRVAWDYRYMDTWGYLAIFSVTFDANGIVLSKFSQRIERDRGRD